MQRRCLTSGTRMACARGSSWKSGRRARARQQAPTRPGAGLLRASMSGAACSGPGGEGTGGGQA
eukprot:10194144-Alexandrium_andersonii.AAC.1